MKIAIQGELGSFSHEAAEKMVRGARLVPCARSSEVFDRLEKGSVSSAVIPIENTLAGSVAEHYDLLLARNVHIEREFRLRIVHNLIAIPGAKLNAIHQVYSHPVALDQCRELFRKFPTMTATPFYDTAGGVKHIIEQKIVNAAGIASQRAAKVYGARILKAGIEDDKRNFTRFFLLRKGPSRITKNANKTSIAFSVKNLPGALFKALSVFALRDLSLSKIESRPFRGRPWEYVFYVDFLRGDDDAARNALHHLAEVADLVKLLGIYRAAA
ncbi:MAG TPA: prephenate dehydratase [Terriglobales bacterium]|jgi:prephenate dehydratase|nr:prephenate dehydratase [Terriglobales bacterium]